MQSECKLLVLLLFSLGVAKTQLASLAKLVQEAPGTSRQVPDRGAAIVVLLGYSGNDQIL